MSPNEDGTIVFRGAASLSTYVTHGGASSNYALDDHVFFWQLTETRKGVSTKTLSDAVNVQHQIEADEILLEMIHAVVADGKATVEEAGKIVKENIAYYAGYYGNDVRERVEKLYGCTHPVFGSYAKYGAQPTEMALEMGRRVGELSKTMPLGEAWGIIRKEYGRE